jgi:hypothetical protein
MNWKCLLPLSGCWILGLLLTGCQPSKSGGGNVSGQVTLVGTIYPGETTVGLYDYGSNEPFWSITSAHSCVGFPYSPAADFDWRLQPPVQETTADAAGKFTLTAIPNGTYIVCARHDSFGWNPPVTVTVQGRDVSVGAITLYREVHYSYLSLAANTTFEENHHYVFDGIVNVPQGITLTIQAGAVLRFGEDRLLVISGTLVADGTPEKWIIWTPQSDTIISAHWNMVQFNASATSPHLLYNRIEGAYQGVNSQIDGTTIENCFFRRVNAEGLTLSGQTPRVLNCIFYDIGATGAVVNTALNPEIESSIFYRSGTYGVMAFHWDGGMIHNNWFEHCGTEGYDGGINILLSNDVLVSRNVITNSYHGIYFGSKCDSTDLIRANSFSNLYKGVYIGFTQENTGPTYPTFLYNCMTNVETYCIHIGSCTFVNHGHNLQCVQNYWGTTSEAAINQCMWEHQDDDDCPFIFITPFLTSCPDTAGVIC